MPSQQEGLDKKYDQYLDMIIKESKYPPMTFEQRMRLKLTITDARQEYIDAQVLAQLSEAELDQFTKLLESNPPADQPDRFLAAHIPNLTDVVAQAAMEFREAWIQKAREQNK